MKVSGLSKRYEEKHALRHVDLTLVPEEITGLLGTNGAGKSTLIKCLLGFVRPDEGRVELEHELIGYLPEIALLPDSVTARQLLHYVLRLRKADRSQTEPLLDEVGLSRAAWDKRISTYSKGMRQRTALAFALAGNPHWLVLDEPMSGLDAIGRQHVLEILRRRKSEGCSILFCSHIVPDLVRLCDRVLIMADGEIREDLRLEEHSMQTAEELEAKLAGWSGDHGDI